MLEKAMTVILNELEVLAAIRFAHEVVGDIPGINPPRGHKAPEIINLARQFLVACELLGQTSSPIAGHRPGGDGEQTNNN